MEFRVLGPVEVVVDGQSLPIGGAKPRGLLAILLLRRNTLVARDRLIEGLWGEAPPSNAGHSLDDYVSRLRKLLGSDRIERRTPGYRLLVGPGELDLDRFEQLTRQARASGDHGHASHAAALFAEALALWRGEPLADVLGEPFAAAEVRRLEEEQLDVLEERIDVDLALGRRGELVAELDQLVGEHPYRERLAGALMLALYGSGQQARALDIYRTTRQRLVDELGVEPGEQLRKLERQILEQNPSLQAELPPSRAETAQRRPSRRRPVAAGVGAAVLAASAAIWVVSGAGTAESKAAAASGVVSIDPRTGAAGRAVPLSVAPTAISAGGGSLWLADATAGTVARFDPRLQAVVDPVPVEGSPSLLAVGGGYVWATSVPGDALERIDPSVGKATQTLQLGGAQVAALAFARGRLWVADASDDSLLERDPGSTTVQTVRLPIQPTALAIGGGSIWVADYNLGLLTEVALRTGKVLGTIPVGAGSSAVTVAAGSVWVANALDSTLTRIDPVRDSVAAVIPVGSGPQAVAAAGGSVWVANQYSGTVSRIDPRRGLVVQTVPVGGAPTSLAVVAGRLWVGTSSLRQHRGGTLRLLHSRPITIDPALQVDLLPLQSDALTRDGLVTYNHAPGAAGTQIVPDLALSVAAPTDGGTTYTFRLRPGIRYSDGQPVYAADFRRALERLFRLHADGRLEFTNLVGASRCTQHHCDLSRAVVTDEAARTVTFHLQAPDPNFLSNLTGSDASAVPAGTPFHDVGWAPIPGTGPYKIASASSKEIRWVRNPFFHEWSHAAQPDGNPNQIIMRFGLSPAREMRAIEVGRADYAPDDIPARLLPGLQARFASQLHSNVIPTTDFLQLNTTLPPFNDVPVRQALNLALDRAAIVHIYGGHDLATPTCQILPPDQTGYHRYCPYTRNPHRAGTWSAPNLARARRLVEASGTRGTKITVWGWTDDPTISPAVIRYTAGALRRLGYRARVRLVPHAFFNHPPAGVFNRIQLIATAWGDTTFGFFATWFACHGPGNHGWFCEPSIDRQNLRARSLTATDPQAAAALWGRIDHELVDQAAAAPMINERGIDFVSARTHNYQSHPYWGVIADQLWLR